MPALIEVKYRTSKQHLEPTQDHDDGFTTVELSQMSTQMFNRAMNHESGATI